MPVKLTLMYKRHAELVGGRHLYTGKLALDVGGKEQAQDFIGSSFADMFTKVSRVLREYPDAKLVLLRTERAGIQPLTVDEDLRVLLRDDPVRAIAMLDLQPGAKVDIRESRAATSDLFPVGTLGPVVYLRMKTGVIENPITGTWGSLAYISKTKEWAIKGADNNPAGWLRIKLAGVYDGLEADAAAQILHKCTWAEVAVADLLKQPVSRFFIPRAWNPWITWITREDLQRLLKEHSQKEGVV